MLDIDSKLCRIMRNMEKIKVMKFRYSKSNILGCRVRFIKRVINSATLGPDRVKVRKFTFSNHIDTETRVNKEQNKRDHMKKY